MLAWQMASWELALLHVGSGSWRDSDFGSEVSLGAQDQLGFV